MKYKNLFSFLPMAAGLLASMAGFIIAVTLWHSSAEFSPPPQSPISDTAETHNFNDNGTALRAETETRERLHLQAGDSLIGILLAAEIGESDAYLWAESIAGAFDVTRLQVGHKIELVSAPDGAASKRLQAVNIFLSPLTAVAAWRGEDGDIRAEQRALAAEKRLYRVTGEIDSSLYEAAMDAGLPANYLARMVRYYSFDIDFQRDIKKGDSFDIMFEDVVDEDGTTSGYGDILSMNLTTAGESGELFLFRTKEDTIGYYDKHGVSAEKALLKTPIDGARLSSGYGMRKHPISGYTQLHKGVDFAAPTGTPIYAAGRGTVEYVGRNGGYGRYIRVRHAAGYKTAYAHLSGYAVRSGERVRLGQTIGYVGSSGRSTGPHLHYEIWRHGRAINPSRLKLPSTRKLSGAALAAFRLQHEAIVGLATALRHETIAPLGEATVGGVSLAYYGAAPREEGFYSVEYSDSGLVRPPPLVRKE